MTVSDTAGNSESFNTAFTIPKATSGGTGDGESSGGGGGGSVPPPSILKEVTPLSDGGVEMTIQNGLKGRSAQQYFDGIEAGDVTFDRLRVTYAYNLQEFTFQLYPGETPPGGASSLESADPLGYLSVERSVQNGYFESVSLRFEVPKSALPEGMALDDVALYRYDGGSWERLETTRRGTTFEATPDGFATFAVGAASESGETQTTPEPTITPGTEGTTTPNERSPTEAAQPSDGQTGFGAGLTLVVLVAALFARRRQ